MGSQHQDIIEINGKKYDAISGRMISTEKPLQTNNLSTQNPKKAGVVVDGFMRAKKSPLVLRTTTKAQKTVQKSQTLMRTAVKKPSPAKKPEIAQPKKFITKPTMVTSKRLENVAVSTPKSPMISRFGDVLQRSSVVKQVELLPVKSPVSHADSNHVNESRSQEHISATSTLHSSRSKATSVLIEKALSNATSHQQPHYDIPRTKKRHKLAKRAGISSRAMAVSTSVIAGVLLGGFFAIQNVPNLSMRVAATRAGFAASMPSYKPSGFSFKGPINYSKGQVTVSFKSNTDDRGYSVTERSSNWNSDALLSNFVVAENKQYQTYIDRGRTLYIYDGSNATWVDNGVWYQIDGPSDMTTDQLVRIASSI